MGTIRVNIQTLLLDGATLTRVGYTDVAIPAEFVGLSAHDLARAPWRSPLWTDGEKVRIGAAVWFADVGKQRIAFDPFQAADGVLRVNREAEQHHQTAIAQTLAEAGFARESVTLLVMTHIDGAGMAAHRDAAGTWTPFFPNARILMSDVELSQFLAAPKGDDAQSEAWHALIDLGIVDTYVDHEQIVPGLSADVRGAHGPGHSLLHFGSSNAPVATFLGHLAVSPLHIVSGECAMLQEDPPAAWALLQRTIADARLLIGPLWPTPGFGRWERGELVAGNPHTGRV